MRKILAVIGIVFLVGLLFVPLVSASYVCPAAYYEGSTLGWYDRVMLTGVYPSSTTAISAGGEVFTTNSTAYLYNVTVDLKRVGTPSAYLIATLRSYGGGTIGTNGYPSGTVLNSSVTFLSAMDVQLTYSAFTFDFGGTYELQNNTNYAVTIQVYNGTIDSSNKIYIGGYNPDAEAGINFCVYHSSGWLAAAQDIYFIINGDTDINASPPTPTPAPGATTSTGDADIENLTAIILPWLVPLLVCLIPALLGYKFVGELGFFIGLNVGVILAYVTLAGTAYAFPLWGIILVGVMDVAVVLIRR